MVDYLSLDAEGGPGLQMALSGRLRADLSCLGPRGACALMSAPDKAPITSRGHLSDAGESGLIIEKLPKKHFVKFNTSSH